jgi:hypothetical protein
MEAELLVLLAFLVFVWLPVTVVFLRNQRPDPHKVGKKNVYKINKRYRRYFKAPERKLQDQACRLLSEIGDALNHNQRIQTDRKSNLKEQANQTTDYVLVSLGKVARMRKHKAVVNAKRQAQITVLEDRLLVEVKRSIDVLEDALVSLTILDAARGDATVDRLLDNLAESNARLRDLADAHEEVRSAGRVRIAEL